MPKSSSKTPPANPSTSKPLFADPGKIRQTRILDVSAYSKVEVRTLNLFGTAGVYTNTIPEIAWRLWPNREPVLCGPAGAIVHRLEGMGLVVLEGLGPGFKLTEDGKTVLRTQK